MTRKKVSIRKTLRLSNILMVCLTIIPVLIIAAFYMVSIRQYRNMIDNVNAANEILANAPNEIESAVWYKISGKDQDKTPPYQVVYEYSEKLTDLRDRATTVELRQTAVVASRLLETIEHYVWEIDSNINNQVPIEQSEQILDEIREVDELLSDKLQEYVASEINLATQKSQEISNVIIILVLIELMIVIGLLLLVRYFSRHLNRSINEPLAKLSQMVSQVSQGDWHARVEKLNVAELDELSVDLNKMSNQLEILFEQNTQKQKSLAVAEMKVLQAQITPHFIYNSLDAILTLAQQGDNEQVQEITYALSNFFKITLNKGSEWITVARELEHVKSYLDILKIRYGPILSYEISVESEIYSSVMLKMILQPLVENAMYHGIKSIRGRGLIEVIGGRYGDDLFFTITDNGIGMDEATLAQVRQNLQQATLEVVPKDLESGYGLYNVYRRLKLYFGEQAQLTIESRKGMGTSITLIIPEKKAPIES